MSIDTGKAKLPALPAIRVDDPALQKWIQAVAERLEVREGQRGNDKERAVTVRDLEAAVKGITGDGQTIIESNGDLRVKIGGMSALISVQQFADAIRQTRLYRDLMKRLDDPTRFDDLPQEVRDILLKSIADEAAARGADIRRLETIIQDSNRSLAIATQEVTAALGNNQAGIRELQTAYVNETQATAAVVNQLESSLGNYYQDGSPGRVVLEEQLTTQASYVNGLRGQYTLKIQAGGALAGFGLAAEEVDGVPSSAFIISADKFAVVAPDYTGGLTTTPDTNNIPFGVDASGVYINGQVRINTTGLELQQVSRSVRLTAPTNVFKQDATGAWDGDTILITANKLGGLTATPSWSVVSGTYSGSLVSGNSLTVSRTSMSTDVVVLRATCSQDGFNYADDFTVAKLADGSNAITAILTNETHAVSADAAGNVTSYTGSGTIIRVYEGSTELQYDGAGTSNGRWTVSASGSSITPGSISDGGSYAIVGNQANFLTASDAASITYTISGKTQGGSSFSATKLQTFSKARTGAQGNPGADGADGAAGARGSQTFYATGSSWSDTTANSIVTSVTGSSTRIIGDTVTISNGSSFAATKYWSGLAWVTPGVVIDGNLLVNGTISGSKIAGTTITGDKIAGGTVTADKIDSKNLSIKDASGNVIFSASNNLSLSRVTGQITLANASTYIAAGAIDTAYISDAAIKNAKIDNGAITTLKIGVGEVDTLRIQGNAVTAQASAARTTFGSVSFVITTSTGGALLLMGYSRGSDGNANVLNVAINGSTLDSALQPYLSIEGQSYIAGYSGDTPIYGKTPVTGMNLIGIGPGTFTISAYGNGNNGYVLSALLTVR